MKTKTLTARVLLMLNGVAHARFDGRQTQNQQGSHGGGSRAVDKSAT